MTNSVLFKNLEVFLSYLEKESFKKGRSWALELLRKQSFDAHRIYCEAEENPAIECSVDFRADQWLLLYAASYFSARVVIENSYRYQYAESLINFGVNALEKIDTEFDPVFIDALKKFSRLQRLVCNIDRGIYNNQAEVMKVSGQELENNVTAVLNLRKRLNSVSLSLFEKNLAGQLKAYHCYASSIKIIASLNLKRWGDVRELREGFESSLSSVAASLEFLEETKHQIMATDLDAQIPVLKRFLELRKNQNGTLFVESGQLTISYYARLGHNLTQPFFDFIRQEGKDNDCGNRIIDVLKTDSPVLGQMSDIWSGFAEKGLLDTYTWSLPAMSLDFRGGKLTFEIELIYYATGIFSINFCSDLTHVSASGVRHAMNLGSPHALDESFFWACDEKKYSFLYEFAEFSFKALDEFIHDRLKKEIIYDEGAIYYDIRESRFVLLRIDRAVEENENGFQRLDAQSLRQHIAFPALVLPQREVRSAVDDWVMRIPPPDSANLAPMCYNRDESLLARRHEAVFALLEQPNWAREQAAECLRVAAMIIHLFNLANVVLGERLRLLAKEAEGNQKLHRKSFKELGEHRNGLELELVYLNRFDGDVNRLLGLIEAGSMMTYPDHSDLMLRVFKEMGFDGSCHRANQTLSKMKELHRKNSDDLENTYARVKNLMARRMNRLLFGVLALISIGALKDLFFILNGAGLGLVVSGFLQFIITSGVFFLVIIMLFSGGSRSK